MSTAAEYAVAGHLVETVYLGVEPVAPSPPRGLRREHIPHREVDPTPSRLRWVADSVIRHQVPLHLSSVLRDGQVVQARGAGFLFGVRPWSLREEAIEVALRTVRTGLADVLVQLGEKPGPSPSEPVPVRTTRGFLADLRLGGHVEPGVV